VANGPEARRFARRAGRRAIFAPGVSTRALRLRARLSVQDDCGVTSIEYALLAALIAVVISGTVAVFGLSVNNLFLQIVGAF